jgi:DNA-directed RNA polymerase specialized sigma subunit
MVDIEDFINSIEVSTATDKKVKDRILNVVDDTHKAVLFAVYLLNYSRADVSAVLKLSDFEVREIISKYQMEWE